MVFTEYSILRSQTKNWEHTYNQLFTKCSVLLHFDTTLVGRSLGNYILFLQNLYPAFFSFEIYIYIVPCVPEIYSSWAVRVYVTNTWNSFYSIDRSSEIIEAELSVILLSQLYGFIIDQNDDGNFFYISKHKFSESLWGSI